MAKVERGITEEVHKGRKCYSVRMTWRGRQYRIGRYDSLAAARIARDKASVDMAAGVFVPPATQKQIVQRERAVERETALTFSEWSKTALEQMEREGRKPGTMGTYYSALKLHWLPRFGNVRLTDIRPSDIDRVLAAIPTKGARDNAARVIRAVLKRAASQKAGGLVESPVKVSTPKPPPLVLDGSKVATPEQVQRLYEAMPEHVRVAVFLGAYAALRKSEVLGLQRQDVDVEGDTVSLHVRRQWSSKAHPPCYTPTKAEDVRLNALPSFVGKLLLEHMERFTPEGGTAPLFPSPLDSSRPFSHTRFGQAWEVARESVGMAGFLFHNLRHTGLTMYARSGATTAEIMARGGHRSVEVALMYQHATRERDRANVERMEEMLGL